MVKTQSKKIRLRTPLLILAGFFTFVLVLLILVPGPWAKPYDESHPASVLAAIEGNSVIRFPDKMESVKAADRVDRGVDSAFYVFIIRFTTDKNGLAQFRQSLSFLYKYSERKFDSPQYLDTQAVYRSLNRPGQIPTPQWYRESPEGNIWTASGQWAVNIHNEIRCAWVVLAGSEEVVVFMEGEGDYSLKDYGD